MIRLVKLLILPSLLVNSVFFSHAKKDSLEPSIHVEQVDEIFDFHSALQQAYLASDDYTNIAAYASGVEELSKPRDLVIDYLVSNIDESEITNYFVDLSTSEDFDTYKRYISDTTSVSINNLLLGTKYYYRVIANTEEKQITSNPLSFTTIDNGVRNINIDGVTNVRDIGGKYISANKRIKQGLIYRNGRYNSSWLKKTKLEISEAGLNTVRNDLHIATEIDLRKSSNGESSYITKSVLGDDINYYDCSMEYNFNTNTFYEKNKSVIKAAFNVFSNAEMYPISFHCHIGTDRTGGMSFLLLGLLGASQRDLEIDYLFSNFGNIEGDRSVERIREDFASYFDQFKGDSLSIKIRNYLLSIGVKEYRINAFINNMIEEI